MKLVLLLLSALIPLALAQDDIKAEYVKWMKKHKKSYVSKKHADKSFKNFGVNHQKIQKHNEKFEHGNETFTMAHNHMSDLSEQEFKETILADLKSYRTPSARANEITPLKPPKNWEATAPKNVDLRTPDIPVKNQGSCGSCWAFSGTSVVEQKLYTLLKKYIKVSEQQCVSCASGGCNGGNCGACIDYFYKNGVVTDADNPYTEKTGTCNKNKPTLKGVDIKKELDYYRIPDEITMAYVVSKGKWVTAALDATDLMSYENGVVRAATCGKNINHAITIVGYGVDAATNMKYWYVRNSWSTNWGNQGYCKVERGKNACGIGDLQSDYDRMHLA